ASGNGLGYRPHPGNDAAGLGVRAWEVGSASLRASLGQLAPAALGARDAERDRLDVLALGVPGAADETAEATLLVDHRLAAQVAVDPCRLGLRLRTVSRIPRVLAVRVTLARQESTVAAPLLEELPLAALRAGLVGGLSRLAVLPLHAP